MNVSRRDFASYIAKGGAALAVAGNMIWLTGCGLFDTIMAYVGVGVQAFQSVVDLLVSAGVIPVIEGTAIDTIIALVKSGFADLQAAVTAYNNAPADQKDTLKHKIALVLGIIEADIQRFWNDLKIPDAKLASLVEGLLGIIISTLGGFAALLPAAMASKTIEAAKKLPRQIAAPAQKRSVAQFKKDFNAKLAEYGRPPVF